MDGSGSLDRKIDNWKEQLLDLTRRNNMVSFQETKTKSIPLYGKTLGELSELLVDEERIYVRRKKDEDEEDDDGEEGLVEYYLKHNELLSDRPNDVTGDSLYKMYLRMHRVREEKGVDALFLSLGMLHWSQDDEPLQSPLLMVPVSLVRKNSRDPDRYDYHLIYENDDVLLNPALRKKLLDEHNIELPEDGDMALTEVDEVLDRVADAVQGQPGWSVGREVVLGIFDFIKLGLFNDIEENREAIKQDPLVRGMTGDLDAVQQDTDLIPRAEELDDLPPQDSYQVLDADSSQQEAIEAAKRGVSFVLQGPPGTGKSQTIANIVAEKLAVGEKVLFVSEKKAALDVVKKRLDEVGLGRFCLEVHGGKANKKRILESLETELNSGFVKSPEERSDRLEELRQKRERLNSYGDELLAEVGEAGVTVFEAQGVVSRYPDLDPPALDVEDPLGVPGEEVQGFVEALEELMEYPDVVRGYGSHPWMHTEVEEWGVNSSDRMEECLMELAGYAERLTEWSDELMDVMGIGADCLAAAEDALELLRCVESAPDVEWTVDLFEAGLPERRQEVRELMEVETELRGLRRDIEDKYTSEIYGVDALDRYEELLDYGLLRYVSPSYRRAKKRVTVHAEPGYNPGYGELLGDLEDVLRINELRERREELEGVAADLAPLYSGGDTDWDLVLEAVDWLEDLESMEADRELVAEVLAGSPERGKAEDLLDEGEELLNDYREAGSFYLTNTDTTQIMVDGTPYLEAGFMELADYYRGLAGQTDVLREWVLFRDSLGRVEDHRFGGYAYSLLESDVEPDRLAAAFRKAYYTELLNAYYRDSDLGGFNGKRYDKLLRDFRELDLLQQEIARVEIQHRVSREKPKLDLEHAETSEQVYLKREFGKTRGHAPLRELFEEAGDLITTLKPCFMMSPLSVAQYVRHGSIDFDCVVFDEASQIMPQDAVSSLIRSDQAVIVGDTKQLPPTRFFEKDASGGPEVREDLESILDEASAVLPEKRLRWHYRSRSEDLIAFSNERYYDGRLRTFPGNTGEDLGVEFRYVEDGVYDRGGTRQNSREAEAVADEVQRFVREDRDRSVGVVAFSSAQEDAIRQELEERREDSEALDGFMSRTDGLEDFFVKSLEVVQGDERDVMIFSVGYGPDEDGRVTMNFGPLNSEGGERRLNVAVTRSREKVVVVSSIRASDIDPDVESRGVRHLRDYLEYAEQGGSVRGVGEWSRDEAVEMRESVREALESRGLPVEASPGGSGYSVDLAVRGDEGYELGIELDGSAYLHSDTARDRDRLRLLVLEHLGWDLHRVWSPEWATNTEAELEALLDRLDGDFEDSIAEVEEGVDAEVVDVDELAGLHNDIVAYEPRYTTVLDDVGIDEVDKPDLREELFAVVEEEAPVRKELAYRKTLERWGLEKVGGKAERRLDQQFLVLREEGEVHEHRGFLWPALEDYRLKVRTNGSLGSRSVSEIALEELAKAAYLVARDGGGIEHGDLVLETARLYGFERTGEKIRERVGRAVELLLEWGLVEEDDGVRVVGDDVDGAVKREVYGSQLVRE